METNSYESPRPSEPATSIPEDASGFSIVRLVVLIIGGASGTLIGAWVGYAAFLNRTPSGGAILAYIATMIRGASVGIMLVRLAYRSWSKQAVVEIDNEHE